MKPSSDQNLQNKGFPKIQNIGKPDLKRIHWTSASVVSIFILLHLLNHISGIISIAFYQEVMDNFRIIYRNVVSEIILIAAVVTQAVTGIILIRNKKKYITNNYERGQILAGKYLLFFLIVHTSAVLIYRHGVGIDTNYYFGSLGLNLFPWVFIFAPYYLSSVLSVFIHLGCVHYLKRQHAPTAKNEARIFFAAGIIVAFLMAYSLTNKFKGVDFPSEYIELAK